MFLLLDVYGVSFIGKGLNEPLLQGVQAFRAKGLRVNFASNMPTIQKTLFWNGLGLKKYGDKILCSGDLHVAKPSPAFYSRVAAELGATPDSILFFDDSAANVDAACACGWRAFVYHDVTTTLKQIETMHHGL
jgi:putative hydrolase of the HAD superfamily